MVNAELTITPPARLAVLLNAACPETVARMMSLTNWWYHRLQRKAATRCVWVWQSVSRLIPSGVTRLSDRASAENNELPSWYGRVRCNTAGVQLYL